MKNRTLLVFTMCLFLGLFFCQQAKGQKDEHLPRIAPAVYRPPVDPFKNLSVEERWKLISAKLPRLANANREQVYKLLNINKSLMDQQNTLHLRITSESVMYWMLEINFENERVCSITIKKSPFTSTSGDFPTGRLK